MNKKIATSLLALTLLTPLFAFAQLTKTQDLLTAAAKIVSDLLVLASGVAMLYFIWGLAKFINKAGSKGAEEEGKNMMMWGVLALFVLVSVYGIIHFIASDLGINETGVLSSGTNTNNSGGVTNFSGTGQDRTDCTDDGLNETGSCL